MSETEMTEIVNLKLKCDQLTKQNARLRESQFVACNGCGELARDRSGIFWRCKYLGAVDPLRDGCTRRRPGGPIVGPRRKEA